jgi:glycosyltransferase involved in cell wall biosynthesis
MRILIHGRFYPSIGGIETVVSILAREWVKAAVDLAVVTDVPYDPDQQREFPFPVYHRPPPSRFLRLLRAHDVFIHFNVSLRALWPLLVVRRPFVASHHGFYVVDVAGHRDWREKFKLTVARCASGNIAVSEAVQRDIGVPCVVIPNPFDAEVFYDRGNQARPSDVVFVGRLVSDKGADLLLKALALLARRGIQPQVTIIGDGPERAALERLVRELDLNSQVRFTGAKSQKEVAEELRRHRILVIASLWKEPFGIVALEGIACGCAVIGSSGGGLAEAIGPCGVTFPNGDVDALAQRIEQLLSNDKMVAELLSHAHRHLARHHPQGVAQQYLQVIRDATCLK